MRQAMKLCAFALVLLAGHAMSADEIKMPDWVPVFPDVKPQVITPKNTDKLEEVTLAFSTKKTPAEVKEFYMKGFKAAGFKETDIKIQSVDDKEDGVVQENLKSDDGKRYWWVSARTDKVIPDTQVSLVYQIKK